jgi:hypothetical protein
MPAILATQEEEVGRILVQGQPRQKVQETLISTNKKLGTEAHACHPSYEGGIERRTAVLGITARPSSKNN